MTVQWTAFPLHPETPQQGQSLEQMFAGRNVDISGMLIRLKATADELGLPFGDRTMTFNSRLAQELGKWADDQGSGETFHLLAFQAYFVHGRNLAETQVLLELARQAGLDEQKAEQVLLDRQYQSAVDEDWQRSRQLGVTAVPTFNLNNRMMAGAQPYATLKQWVADAGVVPRSE